MPALIKLYKSWLLNAHVETVRTNSKKENKKRIKKIGRYKVSEGTKYRAFALKMNFDAQILKNTG